MDGTSAGAETDQDRDGGARQQDSPDRFGRDGAEGDLRRRHITIQIARRWREGCVGAAQ